MLLRSEAVLCGEARISPARPNCAKRQQIAMDRPVQQRIEALDPEKEERTQYPSAAIQRGIDHEWKNREEHEVW